MAAPLHLPVEPEGAGSRLDRWLADALPGHSRAEVQRWIKEGRVTVAGAPVKANLRLEPGMSVAVAPPTAQPDTGPTAEDIPLSILYEDDDLLVVDKPAGMVVHPAPGHSHGTLVNALLHHLRSLAGVGEEPGRAGIVHRLDRDTSGLIVVAKQTAALRNLQAQFKSRAVYKEYIALLEGVVDPPAGRIVAPIGRHPTDRKRMAVLPHAVVRPDEPDEADGGDDEGADGEFDAELDTELDAEPDSGGEAAPARGHGRSHSQAHAPQPRRSRLTARQAVTEYHTLAVYAAPPSVSGGGHFTLVRVVLHTGRTHQIRVHFAWRGRPVVGDPLYGLRRPRLPIARQFLHAHKLRLRLPRSGEEREFVAPLPADLQGVLDLLSRE